MISPLLCLSEELFIKQHYFLQQNLHLYCSNSSNSGSVRKSEEEHEVLIAATVEAPLSQPGYGALMQKCHLITQPLRNVLISL
mmetsp:Transcript_25889/g.37964  ORF Transcript_25889/g.37964 Transcript_25889/m.37964 type:complete len:83 (-) Transcript_25889:712-960(-)